MLWYLTCDAGTLQIWMFQSTQVCTVLVVMMMMGQWEKAQKSSKLLEVLHPSYITYTQLRASMASCTRGIGAPRVPLPPHTNAACRACKACSPGLAFPPQPCTSNVPTRGLRITTHASAPGVPPHPHAECFSHTHILHARAFSHSARTVLTGRSHGAQSRPLASAIRRVCIAVSPSARTPLQATDHRCVCLVSADTHTMSAQTPPTPPSPTTCAAPCMCAPPPPSSLARSTSSGWPSRALQPHRPPAVPLRNRSQLEKTPCSSWVPGYDDDDH